RDRQAGRGHLEDVERRRRCEVRDDEVGATARGQVQQWQAGAHLGRRDVRMSDAPGNPGTSIVFLLGSGATFPARALASRLVDDVVVLTIEVGPEQWSMIDMV